MSSTLTPLAYHRDLADLIERQEPELWNWFASATVTSDFLNTLRSDLLRSTYRLEPNAHTDVYEAARQAASSLGIDTPISIYQAERDTQVNASLVFVPTEIILLLSGSLIDLLSQTELTSVFGHEIAHHVLWSLDNARYLTASRLISAMADEPHASNACRESARRFDLATELFADRGALLATSDLNIAVSTLVKTATGLRTVDAPSYLRQADEVLAETETSTGSSHPETYIRAKALSMWSQDKNSDATSYLSESIDIDSLDLLQQLTLSATTRSLIKQFLDNTDMRTEMTVGHAKLYFPDIDTESDTSLPTSQPWPESTRKYLAHVLLDLAIVDPDLDREGIITAMRIAKDYAVLEELSTIVEKETSLTARETLTLRRSAETA